MAKKKATSFDITVSITPVSGTSVEKTVTVPASATLKEVVEAAGLEGDLLKKNLYVDGKPAGLETRVTAASKVQVTERPQGS